MGRWRIALDAWGFTRHHNDAVYKEFRAVWRNMAELIEPVIRQQFSSPALRTLGPAEVDARYVSKIRT